MHLSTQELDMLTTESFSGMSWTEKHSPLVTKHEPELRHVHQNWVLVTDATGTRRLQMRWQAEP
jgi:hypothetical protein